METMTKEEIAYCEGYERALSEVIDAGSASPCELVRRYREINRKWAAENAAAILRGEKTTAHPLIVEIISVLREVKKAR